MTSRPTVPQRSLSAGPLPRRRPTRSTLQSIPEGSAIRTTTRRPSLSSHNTSPLLPTTTNNVPKRAQVKTTPKVQRTSKKSQKLVELPSEPQTAPLPGEDDEDFEDGHGQMHEGARGYKSEGERMSKSQRLKAGYKRLTAFCVAESFRMPLLAAFVRREHNVVPRVFDEAIYAVYHLPLIPGYGPNVNLRSSVPPKFPGGGTFLARMKEAEERGYEDAYFPEIAEEELDRNGFIPSTSPPAVKTLSSSESDETWRQKVSAEDDKMAEIVFFDYGVVVFFGLNEGQERAILEDLDNASIFVRKYPEEAWEVEECHYTLDPTVAYPRIYNDLFTLKSPSHLLKLSIAHALAQSTLVARYETVTQAVLADPATMAIPRNLAASGKLLLRRRDALKLTGRLFKLRRDINLVSNVLDVPELFWSEASLADLYNAVREYLEISPRVHVLNERLAVANDLLDAIHNHLNTSAMERITWIIIWLIVVACLVELGEVMARLVVHSTSSSSLPRLGKTDALLMLNRMSSS